jgi:hypothetical protein
MELTNYRTLGRSGLAVSRLALGKMTFGAGRWGADEGGSRAIFDVYIETSGNFIDTADVYSGGESEAMIGRFLRERGGPDRDGDRHQPGLPPAARAIHSPAAIRRATSAAAWKGR